MTWCSGVRIPFRVIIAIYKIIAYSELRHVAVSATPVGERVPFPWEPKPYRLTAFGAFSAASEDPRLAENRCKINPNGGLPGRPTQTPAAAAGSPSRW